MIKRGELSSFKVGKSLRIPTNEVWEHEQCKKSKFNVSEVDSPSFGKRTAGEDVFVLKQSRERKQSQRQEM